MLRLHRTHKPIYELEVGETYLSGGGRRFILRGISRHGQDCSIAMVTYENVEATSDYPPGQQWTITESLFLKTFSMM